MSEAELQALKNKLEKSEAKREKLRGTLVRGCELATGLAGLRSLCRHRHRHSLNRCRLRSAGVAETKGTAHN